MFRTTHIRTKLAAALAVPLVALVAVSGFEVVSASRAFDEASAQTELAASSLGPGSLVVRLQDERNRAAVDLIGLGASVDLAVDTSEEARALVDESRAALVAQVAGRSEEVRGTFEPALETLSALDALRADVDGFTGPKDLSNDEFANAVFDRYTALIETLFDATSTVSRSVDDADLRNGVEVIDAATRQSEIRARIVRTAVLATVTGTTTSTATITELAALYDRGQGYDAAIRTNAVGPYTGVADSTFAEPTVQEFNAQVEGFLEGEELEIATMLGALSGDPDSGYLGLRSRAGSRLATAAEALQDDALQRQQLFVVIAAASLILAVLTTWAASRSITRPLRSLKRQAEHMAGVSLPAAVRQILETPTGDDVVIPEIDPITVTSRDEVSDVAGALSAVQSSALDLAVEQAVLRRNISDSYVNLGRRNQNLLSRQLDFITELERNESDPDTLEGLFRLDHLATRMRRNAESLLVLAGIDPPRQWSAPVKVSDVVRAALGEVEDYQRVLVRHLEPAAVTGSVASDIAHVIAELLENALSFSPPEQTVEVKGRLTVTGYTMAITDNGLGMSPQDLERSNRRLAGTESFTVAPSRYLGHYVAGHLASRIGLTVELQDSPAGGVTARIEIPMAVLADEETDPFIVARTSPAGSPASRPAEAAVAPSTNPAAAAPVEAAPPTSYTESGLPRRGERAPAPADAPAPVPAASQTPPAVIEPEPVTSERAEAAAPRPEPQVVSIRDADRDAPLAEAPAASWEPASFDDTPSWVSESLADSPGWEPPPTRDEPLVARRPVEDPVPDAPVAPAAWDAPASPAAEPAVPARPDAARGFGGLAVTRPSGTSMFTIAAEHARRANGQDPAPTTPTGLARRVPGAQRPDMPLGGSARPAPPTEEPERTTPEDVYAFLSSFQTGVTRGRADASSHDTTEDER